MPIWKNELWVLNVALLLSVPGVPYSLEEVIPPASAPAPAPISSSFRGN